MNIIATQADRSSHGFDFTGSFKGTIRSHIKCAHCKGYHWTAAAVRECATGGDWKTLDDASFAAADAEVAPTEEETEAYYAQIEASEADKEWWRVNG